MSTSSTESSSFGTLLKAFRHRQHLTQARLAERLGVHRHAIGRWEQGDMLPASKTVVLELARHLRLDDQESRQLLEASLTALAPHWSVPLPRNPFFTGREALLEVLHTHLRTNQVVALTQSYALHGLGGVGKTQIALEYAYRQALEYSAVFWIGAETSEQIISSLLHIAEVLQLPGQDDKDQQRVVTAVNHWLETHSRWLLIWDNVEDLALLDRFLPATRQGAILITTRRQVLGTLARGIDLVPMEHEEGLLFLLRRAKMLEPKPTHEDVQQLAASAPTTYAAAGELVTALGGLPLALDQAGAYIEETQCSLSAYLDLLRTQRASLLQLRGERPRDHLESVSATFTLSIRATAQRHPAVGDLLRVCGLLQPDAVPEELFRQGAEHLGAALEAACRDELAWNRMVGVACSYSLLHRQPEEQTFSMHRLVQAVLVDAMTAAERELWNRRVIRALEALFPDVRPATEYAAWKQGERLLPHALLCLHQAGAAEESLTLASLAHKVAQYLRERGQYAQAEPLFQRALHIREHVLGSDHPDVAFPLNYLAGLYWEQGRYAQAEPLFLRALHIREQVLGSDHPDVATSLNNLAILYGEQGKYTEAEVLYQRALHIREQVFGPEHTSVAFPLCNVATLYEEQGNYEQAEPLYERALRILEQSLGSEHPYVAQPLNGLACCYAEQGKDELAELLYQRALRIREQALGLDHPKLAHPLKGLADLYQRQGKHEQAGSCYQRALRIREQHLGQDNPETAQSLHDLALFQQQQGNLNEARSLAERALSIRSQFLGDTHPKTVATRAIYAQLVHEHRSLEEEEPSEPRAGRVPGPLREETPTDALAGQDAPTRSHGDQRARAKPLSANALLALSPSSEEPETASRQQPGVRTVPRIPDQLPLHMKRVAVRGGTEQVAYTRTVRMREVTFTCTICGHTVTQPHYPSGRIKYCSEACRAIKAAQQQEERVARQREKRQIAREARQRLQP